MTVASAAMKITYVGNGVTTVWPFTFIGVDADDITVTTVTSAGVVTEVDPSLYSVSLNAPAGTNPYGVGGSVTYPLSGSPLAAPTTITIARSAPLVQDTSLANQGTLYQKVIEGVLDYLMLTVQQLQDQASRSVMVPINEGNLPELPSATRRANQTLLFDNSGNPTAGSIATGAVVSAAMAPVVAAANIGIAQGLLGITTISAAMVPVVQAASIAAAQTLLGITVVSAAMVPVVQAASIAAAQALLGISVGSAQYNYDTVAAVAAVTVPVAANFIMTAGYYAVGDKGGALYKRVGGAPAHTAYIRDLSGAYFEMASTMPTIIAFGGKGDGATTNTAAYNSFLSYAAATGFNYCKFPGGAYFFNTQPNQINFGVNIEGDGPSATVLYRNFNGTIGGADALLQLGPTALGTTISNLTIDSVGATTGGSGISMIANNASGAPNDACLYNIQIGSLNTSSFYIPLWLSGQARTSAPIGIRDCNFFGLFLGGGTGGTCILNGVVGLQWSGAFLGQNGSPALLISGQVTCKSQYINICAPSIAGDVTMIQTVDTVITVGSIQGTVAADATDSYCRVQANRVGGSSVAAWVHGKLDVNP